LEVEGNIYASVLQRMESVVRLLVSVLDAEIAINNLDLAARQLAAVATSMEALFVLDVPWSQERTCRREWNILCMSLEEEGAFKLF
jgi:hypothetical protein